MIVHWFEGQGRSETQNGKLPSLLVIESVVEGSLFYAIYVFEVIIINFFFYNYTVGPCGMT
jgi:hypothetical protein